MSGAIGRFLRRIHPEGIPWPATILYSVLSGTEMFRRHYALVADDVARYGSASRVLDIGTGPGWLLPLLREHLPDADVVGVDISAAMTAQARKNLGTPPRIHLCACGAARLPFADGAFDRVVSTGSLHHWKDIEGCFNEINRVLADDGIALVYDLVKNVPKGILRDARREFGRFRVTLMWLHSFEEPFRDTEHMDALTVDTPLHLHETRFVGALYGMVLRKEPK